MTDQETVADDLRTLGLGAGDDVLVHSALSGMDCRPETLLAAMRDVVGSNGTVIVPTFTPTFRHESPDGVFDLAETPSEVGYLTELVRTDPDAYRTLDPIHSFAAVGARAPEIGRLHARNSYDRNNVLGWLHEHDATIVTVGLDPFGRSMTFFHYVEQHAGVERRGWDYRVEKRFPGTVVVGGKEISAAYGIHVQNFEKGVTYDFGPIGAEIERRGRLDTATIAGKHCTRCHAEEIYPIVADVIVNEPERVYTVDSG